MTTLSNICYNLTEHEFIFFSFGGTMSIPGDSTFDVDLPNYTAEIINVEGFVRKKIRISGQLTSDEGGDSATKKVFALANFLKTNSHQSLTLNLQLDGGDLVKEYIGKFVGSFVFGIVNKRPADLQFAFDFIIETSSW